MLQLILEAVNPIAEATVNNTNDTLEILTKVNEFYNTAWDKLLLFGAVIGIVVPFVIQWYQKQAIKINEKEFESKLNLRIDAIKKNIEDEMLKKINKELDSFKVELHKSKRLSIAQSFHVQSGQHIQNKKYKLAIADLMNASIDYSYCDDDFNLKRVLQTISKMLDHISKEELKTLKEVDNLDLLLILKNIDAKPKTGAFADSIKEIRAKVIKINSAEKEKP